MMDDIRYDAKGVVEYRTEADARYGKKHDPASVNFTEAIDENGMIVATVTLEPTSHGQKHWMLTQFFGHRLRYKTRQQAMAELERRYPVRHP